MINGFIQPDSFIHDKVYQYEKSLRLSKNLIMTLIVAAFFVPVFLVVSAFNHDKKNDENVDFLEGFNETEEHIIMELYGDRIAYADSKAFQNKSDYIDKEATRLTGKITYDEVAYQAYYDSVLAEFDAKVDEAKVQSILEERKEAHIAKRKAAAEIQPLDLLPKVYFVFVGLGIALLVGVFWYNGRRLNFIKNKEYLVTTSLIRRKYMKTFTRRVRYYVTVDIPGAGQEDVRLSARQAFAVHEGDEVYVVFHTGRSKNKNEYSICAVS